MNTIIGWSKIMAFSVSGLIWIGFSKRQPNKLLCISSQYTSCINCDTKEIIKCEADYDEENYIAISSCLPDELVDIYGAYGGKPLLHTNIGEHIFILNQEGLFANKIVIKTKVIFITLDKKTEIYNHYGFYTCSFNTNGNYFVFADDGGITILKRNEN